MGLPGDKFGPISEHQVPLFPTNLQMINDARILIIHIPQGQVLGDSTR